MDIAALEVLVIELVSGDFQICCCFKLDESDFVLVMSIKQSVGKGHQPFAITITANFGVDHIQCRAPSEIFQILRSR